MGMCQRKFCVIFRRALNVIGFLLSLTNSAFDLMYPVKSLFSSKTLYLVSILAIVIRCIINFGVCQYWYTIKVWYFTPGLSQIGEDKFREEEENEEYDHQKG